MIGPMPGTLCGRILVRAPDRRLADERLQLIVGVVDLPLQPGNVRVEAVPDDGAGRLREPLPLGTAHHDELPPGDHGREFLRRGVR